MYERLGGRSIFFFFILLFWSCDISADQMVSVFERTPISHFSFCKEFRVSRQSWQGVLGSHDVMSYDSAGRKPRV